MKSARRIILTVVLLSVLAAGVSIVAYRMMAKDSENTPLVHAEKISAPESSILSAVAIRNPLTGQDDFNLAAKGRRPVAIVVENNPAARPQWGMDDEKNSPDIILQGEVEGGITRMLWFYADDTDTADIIGPVRSARPPFIRFSELFDAIFIHWGMSESGPGYTGANSVFNMDAVDHIDGMTGESLFGRNRGTGRSLEHTGIVHGDKIAAAIKSHGFRTDLKDGFTELSFNEDSSFAGPTAASRVTVHYSSRETGTATWTYRSSDGKYHTSDFRNDVCRDNLVILSDRTEYQYKRAGAKGVTYCNYELAGGTGYYASKGTITPIQWSVDGKKLLLRYTEDGSGSGAGKTLAMNPGKIWIGWISSNNGGSCSAS